MTYFHSQQTHRSGHKFGRHTQVSFRIILSLLLKKLLQLLKLSKSSSTSEYKIGTRLSFVAMKLACSLLETCLRNTTVRCAIVNRFMWWTQRKACYHQQIRIVVRTPLQANLLMKHFWQKNTTMATPPFPSIYRDTRVVQCVVRKDLAFSSNHHRQNMSTAGTTPSLITH